MNLLEYEAKTILADAHIPVPTSTIITPASTGDIKAPVVLKSQVPTGGRGKLGGIKVVESGAEVAPTVRELFGLDIKGFLPSTILAEEKLLITREFYLSIIINRSAATIEIVAHTNGGVEVEDNDPSSFLHLPLQAAPTLAQGEQLAEYYGLESHTFTLQDILQNLYAAFTANDATLIEINPLVLTQGGALVAGDCKMTLDDAASWRHPEWDFEDKGSNANFVTLDEHGQIATIANGAGLAMATVDAVADAGLRPANFLDIGGGATAGTVLAAFRQIMEYSDIRGIVINIFAGITRCDEIARAILAAREQIDDLPPLFIRLAGTNYDEAHKILTGGGVAILPTLHECLTAAKKEVSRG